MLRVPYVHAVFTLPHQLNGIARNNANTIYSGLMQAAWETVHEIGKSTGYTPGMTSVLHTFGSDMKYHIHVHALITFGGLDNQGKWVYPDNQLEIANQRRKKKLFITD